ncbi:hypothetical protein ACVDMB_005196, partial [Escherichia coli]
PGWSVDETTDKEKAGYSPACPDLYSLIFQLINYVTKILSNLTACFERRADLRLWYANLWGAGQLY